MLNTIFNYLDYLKRQFKISIGILYLENDILCLLNCNEFYKTKIENYLKLKNIVLTIKIKNV